MSAQHSLQAVPFRARIDTDRLRLNHPIADLITRYGIELRRIRLHPGGQVPIPPGWRSAQPYRLSAVWSVRLLPLPGARRRHQFRPAARTRDLPRGCRAPRC